MAQDYLETKGMVRKIREGKDECFIAVFPHDGYFTIPGDSRKEETLNKFRAAYAQKSEISFSYDREMRIVSVK